jgi:predicted nucleic acid-binding protein
MIVVDANVAAKWYLPEAGSEGALEIMAGPHRLFAPDLIRIEVLGSLTRCVRTGEAAVEETRKRCSDWVRHLGAGAVALIPEAELLDDALTLALQIKHNLHDCLYLAAARRLDAALITADKKFRDRASVLDKRVSLLAGCEGD